MAAPPVPPNPEVRRWRAAVGLAARWHGPDSPEALAARQALRHAALSADVRDALAAGHLSPAHRRDLADMLLDGAA
ncbi:hypothetical protein [Geodermatophilus arenarius]|uniref:Uncharacterized protein n=1 Tax=Geodermatophilus arenarius TaxID=1137990 RepID=A0ABV9LK96_9ACTN